MSSPDHDATVMVLSIVLAMAGMFVGLAATGTRRIAWIRVSPPLGSAAIALVAVLWAFGLSEPNHGVGMECSENPQRGCLASLVLAVLLAGAAVAAETPVPDANVSLPGTLST